MSRPMRRPLIWYVREVVTLAAITGFCCAVVQLADRVQPGAFPQ
jgi:hypothetical protein